MSLSKVSVDSPAKQGHTHAKDTLHIPVAGKLDIRIYCCKLIVRQGLIIPPAGGSRHSTLHSMRAGSDPDHTAPDIFPEGGDELASDYFNALRLDIVPSFPGDIPTAARWLDWRRGPLPFSVA